ncbi:MAG: response regulator transcription factor [Anaerolineae bacterium]|nr:response regulator transcription factor [Anaerolineae bacterium]NUQ03492.1 response regulator transcription factor [Anaerolineae bacterium]
MSEISEVRTLIVADSPLARAGMSALLDGVGIVVVGGIGDEIDLLDAVNIYHPDVIVWDMGWEPLGVIERIADLRGRPLVLALTADRGAAVEAAPALLGSGAKGLLLQSASGEALCAALHAVAQGMVVIDPVIAVALHPHEEQGVDAGLAESLTAREMEVVGLIAEGLPNKSIARSLGISEHTVKFHVNAILTKLGAQSRTEAVVRATRLGLISL